MSTAVISLDEFQALEQKVLRAVEIVKKERELRAAAEAEVALLRDALAQQSTATSESIATVKNLEAERTEIRKRVETMLSQMEELV